MVQEKNASVVDEIVDEEAEGRKIPKDAERPDLGNEGIFAAEECEQH